MGLLDKLGTVFHGPRTEAAEAAQIERIVRLIDPALRAEPNLAARLEPTLRHAQDYCARFARAIPGPYPISPADHPADPLLATLFPSVDDITDALGRSIEVREQIEAHRRAGNETVHALLGMRQRSRCPAQTADRTRPPAWQRPRFADHTLRSLGATDRETREQLAAAAFDSLLHGFAQRVQDSRQSWKRLHSERQLRMEMACAGTADGFPPDAGADDHATIDRRFEALSRELTPPRLLAALVAWLQRPEEHLRLELGHAEASALMPLPDPQARGLQRLDLPVLIGNDRRKWPVCLVSFALEDALAALAHENRAHRYIII